MCDATFRQARNASEGVGSLGYSLLANYPIAHTATGSQPSGEAEDTDDFRISRLDLENGPEVIRIDRK